MAKDQTISDGQNDGTPVHARPIPPMIETPLSPTLAPVSPGERVAAIDILRGVALLGILLENMLFFGGPMQLWDICDSWWPRPVDQVVIWLIAWLEQGKMYSLYAFLFGVGIALQGRRVDAGGGDARRLYIRRMVVLLLIGVAHATLLWWGDILMLYAMLGFVLLPLQRQSERRLLQWAVFLWVLPIAIGGVAAAMAALGQMANPATAPVSDAGDFEAYRQLRLAAKAGAAIYADGSFGEIFVQRLQDTGAAWLGTIQSIPGILMMMVIGVYVGRRGIFQRLDEHRVLVRRLFCWGLPVGLLCHLAVRLLSVAPRSAYSIWVDLAIYTLFTVGTPLATFGYAAAVILLVQNRRFARVVAPLAAAGELSLTNYLLQSVICTTLFYSYGLAMFGEIGPALGLLPTVVIYAAEVRLSVWWLRRFRFGPFEWVWRSLVYARVQPMQQH